MKTCKVTGCDMALRCLGYCAMHEQRVRRHGDPTIALRKRTHGFQAQRGPNQSQYYENFYEKILRGNT